MDKKERFIQIEIYCSDNHIQKPSGWKIPCDECANKIRAIEEEA